MEEEPKILDCAFTFKCPQRWNRMETTARINIRFCVQCSQHVYFADSKEKLEELKSQGVCVAVLQENDQPHLPPITTAGIPVYVSTPETPSNTCPKCKTKLPVSAIFCGRCGTKLCED